MFFQSWHDIWRVLVVGVCSYVGLILFLRLSGKRTLSKMNAFDLVVTVALGSTLATILLSREVSLLEGLTAFAILIFMQFGVAWLQLHVPAFHKIVKSEPRLLYYRGRWMENAMRGERVVRNEILQAIRSAGNASLESIEAVVLETDGTFAVVTSIKGDHDALENLSLPERPDQSDKPHRSGA